MSSAPATRKRVPSDKIIQALHRLETVLLDAVNNDTLPQAMQKYKVDRKLVSDAILSKEYEEGKELDHPWIYALGAAFKKEGKKPSPNYPALCKVWRKRIPKLQSVQSSTHIAATPPLAEKVSSNTQSAADDATPSPTSAPDTKGKGKNAKARLHQTTLSTQALDNTTTPNSPSPLPDTMPSSAAPPTQVSMHLTVPEAHVLSHRAISPNPSVASSRGTSPPESVLSGVTREPDHPTSESDITNNTTGSANQATSQSTTVKWSGLVFIPPCDRCASKAGLSCQVQDMRNAKEGNIRPLESGRPRQEACVGCRQSKLRCIFSQDSTKTKPISNNDQASNTDSTVQSSTAAASTTAAPSESLSTAGGKRTHPPHRAQVVLNLASTLGLGSAGSASAKKAGKAKATKDQGAVIADLLDRMYRLEQSSILSNSTLAQMERSVHTVLDVTIPDLTNRIDLFDNDIFQLKKDTSSRLDALSGQITLINTELKQIKAEQNVSNRVAITQAASLSHSVANIETLLTTESRMRKEMLEQVNAHNITITKMKEEYEVITERQVEVKDEISELSHRLKTLEDDYFRSDSDSASQGSVGSGKRRHNHESGDDSHSNSDSGNVSDTADASALDLSQTFTTQTGNASNSAFSDSDEARALLSSPTEETPGNNTESPTLSEPRPRTRKQTSQANQKPILQIVPATPSPTKASSHRRPVTRRLGKSGLLPAAEVAESSHAGKSSKRSTPEHGHDTDGSTDGKKRRHIR